MGILSEELLLGGSRRGVWASCIVDCGGETMNEARYKPEPIRGKDRCSGKSFAGYLRRDIGCSNVKIYLRLVAVSSRMANES